jgi:hypothetical protein
MANVTAERLRDLIGADLDALEAIVHWKPGARHRGLPLDLEPDSLRLAPANELAW